MKTALCKIVGILGITIGIIIARKVIDLRIIDFELSLTTIEILLALRVSFLRISFNFLVLFTYFVAWYAFTHSKVDFIAIAIARVHSFYLHWRGGERAREESKFRAQKIPCRYSRRLLAIKLQERIAASHDSTGVESGGGADRARRPSSPTVIHRHYGHRRGLVSLIYIHVPYAATYIRREEEGS